MDQPLTAKRALQRGSTAPCPISDPHAAHVWVPHGFAPLLCSGEAQTAAYERRRRT